MLNPQATPSSDACFFRGSARILDASALRFTSADANMLQLPSLSAHLYDDAAKIQHYFLIRPNSCSFFLI